MAQDATLDVGLKVDEQSLEDAEGEITAGVEAQQGGGTTGGGDDGTSILAGIKGTLGRILGAVAVLTAIPKLMQTLTRLITLTLLPIAALFSNLLAPVLAKIAKRLGEGDVFAAVRRFASQIIDFASQMRNLISQVETFFQNPVGFVTGDATAENTQTSGDLGPRGFTEGLQDFATSPAGAQISLGTLPILSAGAEFSSSVYDEVQSEITETQKLEGGTS